jgi:hypothetical protein
MRSLALACVSLGFMAGSLQAYKIMAPGDLGPATLMMMSMLAGVAVAFR